MLCEQNCQGPGQDMLESHARVAEEAHGLWSKNRRRCQAEAVDSPGPGCGLPPAEAAVSPRPACGFSEAG